MRGEGIPKSLKGPFSAACRLLACLADIMILLGETCLGSLV